MSNQNAPLAALREEWEREYLEMDGDVLVNFVERLFAQAEAAERDVRELNAVVRACAAARKADVVEIAALQARIAALDALW